MSLSLESWGGTDDWEFTFEPEIIKPAPSVSRSTPDPPGYEDSVTDPPRSYQSFQSFSSSSSQSVRKQPDLLRLSPSHDLIFSPNSYGDLTARIQISNVSRGMVAYKMKTTTPERFKVKPSNGCLSPGESSMMDIMVTKSHLSQSDNIGNSNMRSTTYIIRGVQCRTSF